MLAALTGLIPGLTSPEFASLEGREREAWIALQVGVALRAGAWGFLTSIFASLVGRLIEGGFEARSAALDALVEEAYGSVSPGELAEITRRTQQRSLETLGKELTQYADDIVNGDRLSIFSDGLLLNSRQKFV